jgi:hypothetical protein
MAGPRWSRWRAISTKKVSQSTAHSSQITVNARSSTATQEWTANPTAASATVSENQPSPSFGQPVIPLMPTHR